MLLGCPTPRPPSCAGGLFSRLPHRAPRRSLCCFSAATFVLRGGLGRLPFYVVQGAHLSPSTAACGNSPCILRLECSGPSTYPSGTQGVGAQTSVRHPSSCTLPTWIHYPTCGKPCLLQSLKGMGSSELSDQSPPFWQLPSPLWLSTEMTRTPGPSHLKRMPILPAGRRHGHSTSPTHWPHRQQDKENATQSGQGTETIWRCLQATALYPQCRAWAKFRHQRIATTEKNRLEIEESTVSLLFPRLCIRAPGTRPRNRNKPSDLAGETERFAFS